MAAMKGAIFALAVCSVSAIKIDHFNNAPGQLKDTQGQACDECNKYADFLDRKDPCVCHASNIMGTFENDATKESHERTGGHEVKTSNVGAEELPEGWMWHCRPISSTEGVWNQC